MPDREPASPDAPARLSFVGLTLDRAHALRRDAAAIATLLAAPTTRFVPIWRGQIRLRVATDAAPEPEFLAADAVRAKLPLAPWVFLGLDGATAFFAIDLSRWDAPPLDLPGGFENLLPFASLLRPDHAGLLGAARGLLHWQSRQRFCGICGGACVAEQAGHVMACQGCGAHHFPRTDAAVIMLVTHDDRALLGRPARFRDRPVFTTLAGFVEPGESLEEAVAREVLEEAGVIVGNVRYLASQPWPFPASLMLGFTAEAQSEAITVAPDELISAAWMTRDEVRRAEGFALPPPVSIARRMIDAWVEA